MIETSARQALAATANLVAVHGLTERNDPKYIEAWRAFVVADAESMLRSCAVLARCLSACEA
jgi:hypothetical protein